MRNQEIVSYLNSIDFSMMKDEEVVSNVYTEIMPYAIQLSTDPFASSSMEKLINLSKPKNLLELLKMLGKSTIYKKLGSRIVECIFKQLFECMYIRNELFSLKQAIDSIDVVECILCPNATHALRYVLMVLSGKKVDKLKITKYKILNIKDESENFEMKISNKNSTEVEDLDNKTYSKSRLEVFKQLLSLKLNKIVNTDSFNTLGTFLQITKSQSMIANIIEMDCSVDNIKKRGFFYEILPEISSSRNISAIYEIVKDSLMELSELDSTSYFMQSFIRNYHSPENILSKLEISKFEKDSNIILCLLESMQICKAHTHIEYLILNFYEIQKNDVFRSFLLDKYGSLDSKYVKSIANFMYFPASCNYNVNSDFLKYFQKSWLKTKSGITLICAFAEGSANSNQKSKFFKENIDLFWNAYKWNEGKKFIKNLINHTQGYSRKKAYEMLQKCNTSVLGIRILYFIV